MEDLTKKAYNFILQCYFGDMSDPVAAAIDRAYSDMASHTLKGFKENEYTMKWECRFNASKLIYKAIKDDLKDNSEYDDWHNDLCVAIIGQYKCDNQEVSLLSYGQAQKWVNMTMKYLLVFDLIFENAEDDRRKEIPEFFKNRDNIEKLHIPLDNYILQYYKKSKYTPWSSMSIDDYKACRKELDKTIEDELNDWCSASNTYRKYDKESYQQYKNDERKKGNTYKS